MIYYLYCLSLCRVTSATIFSSMWVCSIQSSQRALHVTSRIEVVLQPLERSENGAYLLQLILKRHKKWLFSPSQVHKHLLTFSKMAKRVSKNSKRGRHFLAIWSLKAFIEGNLLSLRMAEDMKKSKIVKMHIDILQQKLMLWGYGLWNNSFIIKPI